MAYRWNFEKDLLKLEKSLSAIHNNRLWCDCGPLPTFTESAKSYLIKNYTMEGVRLPSPEVQDCYPKNVFPNVLSNTFSDFISDMEVYYQKHKDQ